MYDHSNKIGNKGDLIKHFALTIAIKKMATGRESFSYLDVHSGRSQYDLPASGEWKAGIGKFSEFCLNGHSLTKDLRYFCEVQSVADVPRTRQYSGSSRMSIGSINALLPRSPNDGSVV
jgi:23S rRNA A2030 N6-methylase RlmJ